MHKDVFVPKAEKTDTISVRVPMSVKQRYKDLRPKVDAAGQDFDKSAKAAMLDLIETWESALKRMSNGSVSSYDKT